VIVTVWDVVPLILSVAALLELVTLPMGLHVFATHVCADPEAAAADNVYPTEHMLQSTVDVSQSVAPVPSNKVGVPNGQVHILATQVGREFHCTFVEGKFEPHTVVPEPDHPGSHVTMIRSSIVPEIESVAALLECNTCVDGHIFLQTISLVSSLGTSDT
jgi:hypothetical protein